MTLDQENKLKARLVELEAENRRLRERQPREHSVLCSRCHERQTWNLSAVCDACAMETL